MSSILDALKKNQDDKLMMGTRKPMARPFFPLRKTESKGQSDSLNKLTMVIFGGLVLLIFAVGVGYGWILNGFSAQEQNVSNPSLLALPDQGNNLSQFENNQTQTLQSESKPAFHSNENIQVEAVLKTHENIQPIKKNNATLSNENQVEHKIKNIESSVPDIDLTTKEKLLAEELKLSGIMMNKGQPMAIINGKLKGVGDRVNGKRILSIKKQGVQFEGLDHLIKMES